MGPPARTLTFHVVTRVAEIDSAGRLRVLRELVAVERAQSGRVRPDAFTAYGDYAGLI